MNKRARTRLIGVTAIILLAVVAVIASGAFGGNTAYSRTVEEVAADQSLVGERVKVSGTVVSGSWDKKQNPMTFSIRDEADAAEEGPTLKVVFDGPVPSTFGDGVVAVVTGELDGEGTVTSSDMLTKCPSKYESAKGAMTVTDLLGNEAMAGKTTKLTGFVKAGSIVAPGAGARFTITGEADGGDEIPVVWEGALPSGMVDGSAVVLTGMLEEGQFVATDVAMEQSQQ